MKRPAQEDFHGYVDGALSAAERARVEAWLADNPADAAQVRQWQQQRLQLQQAFQPVLSEAVPERLLRLAEQREPWAWGRMAAALAGLAVGVAVGYGLPRSAGESSSASVALARPAALAHVVYSPEVRHPVEVGAEQVAHLVQWLSKRLGTSLQAPHLQTAGFQLLGGRLLPDQGKAAAQFMYQDAAGRRVTLYVRKAVKGNQETAFRFAREEGLSVFYWVEGEAGYALSGDLPKDDLLKLAELSYRQLDRPAQ